MNIFLNIISKFKGEGTDQAKTEVDKFSTAQGKVADKSRQASKASVEASAGFGAAGAAASAAAGGGIGSMSSALGQILQQIPRLASMAGTVGLMVAAAASWKKVVDELKEAHEQLADTIDNIQIGNAEARIKSLNEQYKAMADALTVAYERSKMLHDFEQTQDDLETQQALAELELKAAKAKAEKPDDEFHARREDVSIAAERAAILSGAADRRFEREAEARKAERIYQTTQKEQALSKFSEQREQQVVLARKYSEAQEKAQREKDALLLGNFRKGARSEIDEKLSKELESISKKMEAAADAMKAANEKAAAADNAIERLTYEGALAPIRKGIGNIQQQTAAVDRSATRYDINRDVSEYQAAQLEKIEEEKAEAEKTRLSRVQARQNVLAAESNLRIARNTGSGSEQIAELKAALNQARSDRAATIKAFTDYARKAAADAAYAKEAVRNLPNN
jgi:hypothetical protein